MKKIRMAAMTLALTYCMSSIGAARPVLAAEDTISVAAPTVNYMTDPLGIATEGIRFGWKMESNRIGAGQTAYEIEVTKDDGAVVWDTDKVESNLSVGIPYEGPALEDATKYTWTVTVWDKEGNEYTGDEAYFETAVDNDPDWQNAEFIALQEASAAPIFRTEKEIDGTVNSARLYITALGVYSAQVNGQPVYKTENGKKVYPYMNPGYGNGDRSIVYETYDVTDLLKDSNSAVITVTAGIGWNSGAVEGVLGATSGRPAVKAMLVINTDKGTQKITTNTADWKGTLAGPITKNGVYYGEDYDARALVALGDYQSSGYDTTNWVGSARSVDTPYILKTAIASPRAAKYMRLSVSEIGPATGNDGETRLQIMELEVLDSNEINQARNATVTALNSFEYGIQWRTNNINDGDYGLVTDSGYTSDILSKTGAASFTPSSPLTVDFAFSEPVAVASVNIVCRTGIASVSGELCPNYPKTYEIQISDDGQLWETVASCYAGEVWNNVLFPHGLVTVTYAGEIRPSKEMSGQIVDDFEQRPVSAVVYAGNKAQSSYPGGEIDVLAEYSEENMFEKGITLKDGQTMVVNMGQNLTAIPEIKFSATKGVGLNMKFAEMLNDGSSVGNGATQASGPKGSIYTKSLRAARSEAHYTFAGVGEEIYQPTVSFFGYQYVELKAVGGDVTVTSLRSRALSSVSRQTGFITTNNGDVNRLFQNALYGQLSNFFTIPTDCPQRDERLAWTGDAQAFARTAMYNFDSAAFLNGYQELLNDNTLNDGFPSAVLALSGYFRHWATGWSDAEVINAWSYFVQTGDVEFLRVNWDALNRYMEYLENHERSADQAPNVDRHGYGDWLAFQGSGYSIMADYYYGYVTSLMAKIAAILGDSTKEACYSDKFEREKQAYLRTYVTFSDLGDITVLPVPTFENHVLSAEFEPTEAQYLRLTATETGPGTSDDNEHRLQIMELEVYGEGEATNYASGKPVESNNTFNAYGWDIRNLTDGKYDGFNGYSSNTNTGSDIGSSPIYVTVDLGEVRTISRADIFCRYDEEHTMTPGVCVNHPRHFTIEISTDSRSWKKVGEYSATAGEKHRLAIHSSMGGDAGLFMANAGKAGVIEDNSQTALLWMLKLSWCSSDEMRDEAIAMLVENIKNEAPDPSSVRAQYGENTLAVGFMGSNIITPVLSDVGRSDVSYDLLLSTEMPSWLFEVKAGATTIWERWNSYDPYKGFGDAEMNSFNHFAYGSVAEWMYRYMAGIDSANGFKNIILQPTIDRGEQYNDEERIHSVNGRYDSYYGVVESSWEADKNANLTEYHAVIPANTSAVLYLPVSDENVKGFINIPGVTYAGMDRQNGVLKAKFILESGGYDFTVSDGKLSAALADGYTAGASAIRFSAPYLSLTSDGDLAIEYALDFSGVTAANGVEKYCVSVEYLDSGEWKNASANEKTEIVPEEGEAFVAFVPTNSNVPYRLSAFIKGVSGAKRAAATASGTTLYELVIDDIASSGYSSVEELDRNVLAKANAVIGQGGLISFEELDSVRGKLMEKLDENSVAIKPRFANLGIGFICAQGKLWVGSDSAECDSSAVYTSIALENGKVILGGAAGQAAEDTLVLEAIEYDYVQDFIGFFDSDSAYSEPDFVPEL